MTRGLNSIEKGFAFCAKLKKGIRTKNQVKFHTLKLVKNYLIRKEKL